MSGYFVPPGFAATLPAATWPNRCTIQQQGATVDDVGEVLDEWANVGVLVDIPCRLVASGSTAEAEQETAARTVVRNTWLCVLNGYYGSVDSAQRAVIDGNTYGIERVRHDAAQTLTRLDLERIG